MKKLLSLLMCVVMVMSLAVSAAAISLVKVTAIKLNKQDITLTVGQTSNLKVIFTPVNTTQRLLQYSTSNKDIATIDAKGRITAVKAGKVVITVTSTSSSKVLAKCNVTIAPIKPVKLSIIDVAGNAQLSQPAIDAFKAARPDLVSSIELIKLTAPELAAKIRAQYAAKNMETSMIFTGFDGLASCTQANVIERLWPDMKNKFVGIEGNYLPGAQKAMNVGAGFGITYVFCPGGPMFTYNPGKVKTVPKTPQELLAWAKANPGKFLYARPANSGPGRTFLMGLPYILGDADPKDPRKWDKTWAYLKELGEYIDYYPTGTGVTFKELGEGTRWMVASHLGWDMNQRILGTIPETSQAFMLDNSTWITDAQFICIPKGLDEARKNADIALINWLMTPEMQAITYDNGYFYPGPSIKNVPITMAPKENQDKITKAMRPEYEKLIKDLPTTTQLDAYNLTLAYDMWDKLIGSKTKK